jgi:hypothetical protein
MFPMFWMFSNILMFWMFSNIPMFRMFPNIPMFRSELALQLTPPRACSQLALTLSNDAAPDHLRVN